MKALIAILLLSVAGVASADHYRGGYNGYYNNGISPGAAAVIGGIIGYGMGRSAGPIYAPPPVYYPPVVPNAPPSMGALPPAPYGFAYFPQYNQYCNCYNWILIPAY